MADLVNTCLEDSMVILVLAKTLLEKHETIIKTRVSYHRLIELVVGFATSQGLKKSDNRSSSYGCFSEGVSLGERHLPHAKKKNLNFDHPCFSLILE